MTTPMLRSVPVSLRATVSRSMRRSMVPATRRCMATTHAGPLSPKEGIKAAMKQDPPAFDPIQASKTKPPEHRAQIVELETFELPLTVTGSEGDRALGKQLVDSWRKNGILQVQFPKGLSVLRDAWKQSQNYFSQDAKSKAACVDSESFAGYIASGEEITDGKADYSEIFTVTKDLESSDPRVKTKWPCHGPTPWPNKEYQSAMNALMDYKGQVGEKLLRLTALGLGLENSFALNQLAQDGWHHMRVLRFPPTDNTNGKGVKGRGIGSHTDYGLLVIAAQDDVGGLLIRPPYEDEQYANWAESAAGKYENDDKWVFVAPAEDVFTVFPGDMMQFLTNSYLPSTPHKVGLNTRERFATAYFHEPNFNAVCQRLPEFCDGSEADKETVHYGTHFTNMFMRNYPERITAKRMKEESRMDKLPELKEEFGFKATT